MYEVRDVIDFYLLKNEPRGIYVVMHKLLEIVPANLGLKHDNCIGAGEVLLPIPRYSQVGINSFDRWLDFFQRRKIRPMFIKHHDTLVALRYQPGY